MIQKVNTDEHIYDLVHIPHTFTKVKGLNGVSLLSVRQPLNMSRREEKDCWSKKICHAKRMYSAMTSYLRLHAHSCSVLK